MEIPASSFQGRLGKQNKYQEKTGNFTQNKVLIKLILFFWFD